MSNVNNVLSEAVSITRESTSSCNVCTRVTGIQNLLLRNSTRLRCIREAFPFMLISLALSDLVLDELEITQTLTPNNTSANISIVEELPTDWLSLAHAQWGGTLPNTVKVLMVALGLFLLAWVCMFGRFLHGWKNRLNEWKKHKKTSIMNEAEITAWDTGKKKDKKEQEDQLAEAAAKATKSAKGKMQAALPSRGQSRSEMATAVICCIPNALKVVMPAVMPVIRANKWCVWANEMAFCSLFCCPPQPITNNTLAEYRLIDVRLCFFIEKQKSKSGWRWFVNLTNSSLWTAIIWAYCISASPWLLLHRSYADLALVLSQTYVLGGIGANHQREYCSFNFVRKRLSLLHEQKSLNNRYAEEHFKYTAPETLAMSAHGVVNIHIKMALAELVKSDHNTVMEHINHRFSSIKNPLASVVQQL